MSILKFIMRSYSRGGGLSKVFTLHGGVFETTYCFDLYYGNFRMATMHYLQQMQLISKSTEINIYIIYHFSPAMNLSNINDISISFILDGILLFSFINLRASPNFVSLKHLHRIRLTGLIPREGT